MDITTNELVELIRKFSSGEEMDTELCNLILNNNFSVIFDSSDIALKVRNTPSEENYDYLEYVKKIKGILYRSRVRRIENIIMVYTDEELNLRDTLVLKRLINVICKDKVDVILLNEEVIYYTDKYDNFGYKEINILINRVLFNQKKKEVLNWFHTLVTSPKLLFKRKMKT